MPATHEIIFLGTGASCGNPSFYCGCAACEEAVANPAEAKTNSSLAIHGAEMTLIDTAPELRIQFAREGIHSVDRVLFTHEHFDHTGGLPQLEFMVRLNRKTPLPIYALAETFEPMKTHFDWMWDTVEPHVIEPFQTLEFDGMSYTALPASHCPGAVGFLMQSGDWRAAYFPDTGPLSADVLERLEGIDVLIHDSTFIGRNWTEGTHSTVEDTIRLGRELGVKAVYLAHCTLHYDTPTPATALREQLTQLDTGEMQVILPRDGDRF